MLGSGRRQGYPRRGSPAAGSDWFLESALSRRLHPGKGHVEPSDVMGSKPDSAPRPVDGCPQVPKCGLRCRSPPAAGLPAAPAGEGLRPVPPEPGALSLGRPGSCSRRGESLNLSITMAVP